jgi:preprotein translocase SecE subunit
MANRAKNKRQTKAVSIVGKSKARFSFFRESIEELRKAQWPTRREAFRLSLLVMAVCAAVGGILGVLDYGFTKLLTELLLGG